MEQIYNFFPSELTCAGVEEQPVALPHAVLDLLELFKVHLQLLLAALGSSSQFDTLNVLNLDLRVPFGGGRRASGPRRPTQTSGSRGPQPVLLVDVRRRFVRLRREGVVGSRVVTHHAARRLRPVLVRAGHAAPALGARVQPVPVVVLLTRVHRGRRAGPEPEGGRSSGIKTAALKQTQRWELHWHKSFTCF